jgi:hypothetical protein
MSSTSRAFRCRAGGRSQGQAAHRAGRHRPGRRADLLRHALWLAAKAVALIEAGWRDPEPCAYRASAELRRRRARSRSSTAMPIWPAAYPGAAARHPQRHRPARHPQRAADLDRADRHDLAVRRQCLLRHRAGVRLSYTRKVLQPDGSRREEEVERLRLSPVPRELRRGRAAAGYFVDAQTLSPADHLAMQAAAQPISTARSPRPSTCRPTSLRGVQGCLSQAYELGCKGCTTYRPNDVTGAVLEEEPNRRHAPVAAVNRNPLPTRTPAPAAWST